MTNSKLGNDWCLFPETKIYIYSMAMVLTTVMLSFLMCPFSSFYRLMFFLNFWGIFFWWNILGWRKIINRYAILFVYLQESKKNTVKKHEAKMMLSIGNGNSSNIYKMMEKVIANTKKKIGEVNKNSRIRFRMVIKINE